MEKKSFPESAIHRLAAVIASKDTSSVNYWKGPKLVDFFNLLGFSDGYVFADGIGIVTPDLGEGLSRLDYVTGRLESLNKTESAGYAVQKFIDTCDDPATATLQVNKALSGTGNTFKSVKLSFVEMATLTDTVNHKTNSQTDDKQSMPTKPTKEERLQLEKQKLMNEVFGIIPSDRIVVFISYSWDSDEHKEWVADLADRLTQSGYYVLLDQYLDKGTPLEIFMELGIERADKVIVIGTPTYKLKSLTVSGGAPFEGSIIRNAIYQNIGTKKILACVREGSFSDALPSTINGRNGFDFTDDKRFEKVYCELTDTLKNKPVRQRPALGPNPLYETPVVRNQEDLKMTDFRHDNDEKWLNTLFSNFSVYAIEGFLNSSPHTVSDIVFLSHDMWNSILSSMAFKIYRPVLKKLIDDFYESWQELIKAGQGYYEPAQREGYYKFIGLVGDMFASQEHSKTFSDICSLMDTMREKMKALIDFVKDNYEIDLDRLSKEYENSCRL